MTTEAQLQIGRGKNAVLAYFERKLSIPKIYLDAEWKGQHIDVLAFNRDGSGDIHTALIFQSKYHKETGEPDLEAQLSIERMLLQKFRDVPANYKYLCAVEMNAGHLGYSVVHKPTKEFLDESFDDGGVGRVGYLSIEIEADGEIGVEAETRVKIKPERFRAPVSELVNSFIRQHHADSEIRDWPATDAAVIQ